MKPFCSLSDSIYRLALSFGICAAFASCADNDLTGPVDNGGDIRFAVSCSDSWNGGATSRSTVPSVHLGSAGSDLYLHPAVAIGRGSSEGSRSSTVGNDNIASFGVFATYGQAEAGFYMDNVEVTRDNLWTPAQDYRWPGVGSVHFAAYSPFVSAGADEGIMAVPTADQTGRLSLKFTVPAQVEDQYELLWATPTDASASPCTLVFNHALTAVRFVTGPEMAPCTVASIEISGVRGVGRLALSDGSWSDLDSLSSYTVRPERKLIAADGSAFVAKDTPITDAEETFLLIPQVLGNDAAITLTLGDGTIYTASLTGTAWLAGTTVTYHLSAKASSSKLILEITDADGNVLDKLNSPYTGADMPYTVRSYYDDGTGSITPVEWTASFIDDAGNMTEKYPEWVTRFDENGTDKAECVLGTELPEPVFLEMAEQTRNIRNNADINATSGRDRYNLASSTGADIVENTANSYIINAPGKYRLPLVYGNAVKNGANNEAAYVSTLHSTTANKRKALFHFVNHLGNDITDPYIYNNSGCSPSDAILMWEDRLNLVRNVTLSADGKSIDFDVPAASIRQGNAMIAVRDSEGTVMWSWHIWVTDYVAGTGLQKVADDSSVEPLYPCNLGRLYGGDRTEFKASQVKVRFTQRNVPAGAEPLTLDMTVSQDGSIIYTGDCYTYFQWGRKDPMISGLDQYYDSGHHELDGHRLPTEPVGTDHKAMIVESIKNPRLFFIGSETDVRHISPFYTNLWNIDQIVASPNAIHEQNVKTIYDPCPVGSKVPVGNSFQSIITENPKGTYLSDSYTEQFTLSNGIELYIPVLGYRDAAASETINTGSGECWSAIAGGPTMSKYLSAGKTGNISFPTNIILYGFALRPALDE